MKDSKSSLPVIMVMLISSLAFTSCQQDPNPMQLPNPYLTLDQYLNDTPQWFTIDANAGGKITGSKGTILVFPAESFLNPATNQIVTGNVSIELIEVYSKSDMIKNNQNTRTGNSPFASNGQIFVKAYKDGQELTANAYFHIYYPYSGGHFYGVRPWIANSLFWFSGDSYYEILPPFHSPSVQEAKCELPTVVNPNGVNSYRASMNCFGWLGCGTTFDNGDPINAVFAIDSALNINDTNTTTRLFVIFNNHNAVIASEYQPFWPLAPHNFYSTMEIDFGSDITLLVLHANEARYYMGINSIPSMPYDTTLYIPMQEASLLQIKEAIEDLD